MVVHLLLLTVIAAAMAACFMRAGSITSTHHAGEFWILSLSGAFLVSLLIYAAKTNLGVR